MDFMGPPPLSSSNNEYILVMMDTFSRYVELYPLSTPSQAYLANWMYHHFIPRHGLPDEFLSDNGPTFTSEFIVTLASLVQLDLKFAPPYHQQANGIVERFMGTLRRLIISFVSQDTIAQQWDRQLQFLAFAHNTSHLDIINAAPFFICHGRHARIPLVSAPMTAISDSYCISTLTHPCTTTTSPQH